MHRIAIAVGVLAIWLTESASVWAQDCEPLKPSRTIDAEIRNVTQANANILLRSLGQGSIKNDYQRIEQSQPFNNPDDANRWSSFIYMLCTLLKSSSLSDNDKLDQYWKLVALSRQSPPPPAPPPGGQEGVEGLKIVKCRIGPDEVTIEGQGAHMLATGGAGADQVYSGGKMWGYLWRQRDDPNCPAILTRQTYGGGYGSSLPPRFCISAGGMVSELFYGTGVGNCEICNTAGNCSALQIP